MPAGHEMVVPRPPYIKRRTVQITAKHTQRIRARARKHPETQ